MLILNKKTKEELITYFKSKIPYEACGLLASEKNNGINIFYPIPNISSYPKKHFKFDPQIYIQSLHDIENKNLHLIGVIHSHPTTNAFPSKMDVDHWHYPDLSYWIYSLPDDQLNAFFIQNQQVIILNWAKG